LEDITIVAEFASIGCRAFTATNNSFYALLAAFMRHKLVLFTRTAMT